MRNPNVRKYRKTDRLAGAGVAAFLLSVLTGGSAFFFGNTELVSLSFSGFLFTCVIMFFAFRAIPFTSDGAEDKADGKAGKHESSEFDGDVPFRLSENLGELKRIRASIDNSYVYGLLSDFLNGSEKILDAVEADGKRARHARRFSGYYADRAVMFAKVYKEMEDSDLGFPSVSKRKTKIETALASLVSVCDATLEAVLQDDFTDIDAELAVLEKEIAMDGYASKKQQLS